MKTELLINVTPTEARVALVEHGILQEVHIERRLKRGLVGNIYKGKVSRVLPGMQAAFVDIGLDKAAFLHASDIIVRSPDEADKKSAVVADINTLIRQGQEIIVQVVKDPLGTKGARLTTDITLPSRYLVFMPAADYVGVSQRIEQEAERHRLKKITLPYVDQQGGFIIRTAAQGVGEAELAQDAAFLRYVWANVMQRRQRSGVVLLYEDLALPVRLVRDFVSEDIDRILVDSRGTFDEIQSFAHGFMLHIADKIEHYTAPSPLFDLYDVEAEIQRALGRKVELKSGGYLIIDQTEAMTTVDINTGAFVGHKNLAETIFNTNLEATEVIAHQLRLRNLGGIIIIDFIDMLNNEHKAQVLSRLRQALSKDRVKTNVSGFSGLGLVEMTRKRTRESLEHILCGECPTCYGAGTVKTVETVAYEIFREIIHLNRIYEVEGFLLCCAPTVYQGLSGDEKLQLAGLEAYIGKPIRLQNEPLFTQQTYRVVIC